jgi:hypothetical protein
MTIPANTPPGTYWLGVEYDPGKIISVYSHIIAMNIGQCSEDVGANSLKEA